MGFQGNAVGTAAGVVQNSFPNQFATALPGDLYSSADQNFVDSCPVADPNGVVVGRGVVESVLGVSVATFVGTNVSTASGGNGTTSIGATLTGITAGTLTIVGATPTPIELTGLNFTSVATVHSASADTGLDHFLNTALAAAGFGSLITVASTGASTYAMQFTTTSYGNLTVTITGSAGIVAALGLTTVTVTNGVQQPIRTGLGNMGVVRPTSGSAAANFYGVALRTLAGFNVTSIQSLWPYQANAPIMRPTRAGGRVWVESFDTIAVDGAVYLVTVADTNTAGTILHPVGSFTTSATPATAGGTAGTAVLLANAKFKSVGVAGTANVGGEATPGGVVLIEFTGAAG